jgi:hypothetical protein
MDHDAVAALVHRLGSIAVDSLLDRLARASDRSTRAAIMKQLLDLGSSVGSAAVARLPDAPWFLQRNILVLLGKRGSWPAEFSPVTYAVHADARIRREGIKLLLESKAHHDEGVRMGLEDVDDGIVAMALASALESCPVEVLPQVERIAADWRRSSEMRVTAVRILARTRGPQVVPLLVGIALTKRFWFWTSLAAKSPELLAAVSALAAHWRDHPLAAPVLALARGHSDPDVRAAATGI